VCSSKKSKFYFIFAFYCANFYSDGAKACGYFLALAFLVEKIKLEQECDVCHAVRMVRRNREHFVPNVVSIIRDTAQYAAKLPHGEICGSLTPFVYSVFLGVFNTKIVIILRCGIPVVC